MCRFHCQLDRSRDKPLKVTIDVDGGFRAITPAITRLLQESHRWVEISLSRAYIDAKRLIAALERCAHLERLTLIGCQYHGTFATAHPLTLPALNYLSLYCKRSDFPVNACLAPALQVLYIRYTPSFESITPFLIRSSSNNPTKLSIEDSDLTAVRRGPHAIMPACMPPAEGFHDLQPIRMLTQLVSPVDLGARKHALSQSVRAVGVVCRPLFGPPIHLTCYASLSERGCCQGERYADRFERREPIWNWRSAAVAGALASQEQVATLLLQKYPHHAYRVSHLEEARPI